MIVYSNSCSFGAPEQPHKIYPEFISEEFSAELINKGRESSCNRRIIRTSVRDLLELKKNSNTTILALIGLTFLTRTELWQPNKPVWDNDGHFQSIIIDHKQLNWTGGLVNTNINNVHDYADNNVKDYYKQWLLHMSKEALVTDLLTDIIMLAEFCKGLNINLLLWNNTQILPQADEVASDDIFLKSFTDAVNSCNNIINLWNFSFSDYALSQGFIPRDSEIYGNSGHPDGPAHKNFAEYLLNEIKLRNIL